MGLEAAMDVDQTAGGVNVSCADETKLTENSDLVEPLEKTGGSGFDSRDRRKSKYLSSPYTNLKRRNKDLLDETEDLRTPSHSHKAKASRIATNKSKGSRTPCHSSFAKPGSKRFRRNWYRKFVNSNTKSSSPEFINASSDELLSGLQSLAVDCTLPMENKSFDLVEWFFCRYRISKYHDEAELATSLLNDEEEEKGKPEGNDSLDIKSEKKRKNNNMENAVRPKMKSLSGLSDMNVNISMGDSQTPGKKMKKKKKVEEDTSMHQLRNVEINLNESSSKCSSVPEIAQTVSCLPSKGKAKPNKRKNIDAVQRGQSGQVASVYTDAESTKRSSLVIDLQLRYPPVSGAIPEKSNDVNMEKPVSIGSNPEFCVSQGGVGNITNRSLFGSTSASEVGTATVNEAGPENRMEKAAEEPLKTKLPTWIPDLNGTYSESYSTRNEIESVNVLSSELTLEQSRSLSACSRLSKAVNHNRVEDKFVNALSPGLTSEQSRSLSACSELTKNVNYIGVKAKHVNVLSPKLTLEQLQSLSACSGLNKTVNHNGLEDNGESLGTCLLLRFTPESYIPSKEDLMTTFCRFGPLNASETLLLKDNGSAQIVFVRSADARQAFHSIEQNKPFGVVDYKLQHLSNASPPAGGLVFPTQPTVSVPMPGNVEQSKPFGIVDNKLDRLSKSGLPVGRVIPNQPTVPLPMPGNGGQSKPFGGVDKHRNLSEARPPAVQPVVPAQPSVPLPLPGAGDVHPPLQFIKQNLQMMTSILENSGNNLSPQMRAKLDAEIKGLLRKVNSRANV